MFLSWDWIIKNLLGLHFVTVDRMGLVWPPQIKWPDNTFFLMGHGNQHLLPLIFSWIGSPWCFALWTWISHRALNLSKAFIFWWKICVMYSLTFLHSALCICHTFVHSAFICHTFVHSAFICHTFVHSAFICHIKSIRQGRLGCSLARHPQTWDSLALSNQTDRSLASRACR